MGNAYVNDCIESDMVAIRDETVSLMSPAVDSASKQLVPNIMSQSAHNIHKSTEKSDFHMENANTPTLGSSNSGRQDQETASPNNNKDDASLEQVKRPPLARRISRIEDSVEALDALEDAIEKIGEALPTPTNDISSSAAVKATAKIVVNPEKTESTTSQRPGKGASNNCEATSVSTRNKSSSTPRSTAIKSPTAHPTRNTTSVPCESRTSAPKGTQALAETQIKAKAQPSKRVSSIHKAPFVPTKSTKPLTTSTFELPGEAVARKLKEQREERQKREEEERAKTKPFKARPVPVRRAPEVKLTASAKVRLSMVQDAPVNDTRPKLTLRTGNASASPSNKRQSTLHVSKRTTASPMSRFSPPAANTSVKRQPFLGKTMKSQKPSMSNEPRPPPTAEDLAHQKAKGKEVFSRTKVMLSEKEKEKKAKEEAAKKARAEAAERGRTASREWAEKQKARQTTVKKVKKGEEEEEEEEGAATA